MTSRQTRKELADLSRREVLAAVGGDGGAGDTLAEAAFSYAAGPPGTDYDRRGGSRLVRVYIEAQAPPKPAAGRPSAGSAMDGRP